MEFQVTHEFGWSICMAIVFFLQMLLYGGLLFAAVKLAGAAVRFSKHAELFLRGDFVCFTPF